jgi:cell division protease FtsH
MADAKRLCPPPDGEGRRARIVMRLGRRRFAIALFAIGLITLLALRLSLLAPATANITYSEFKALVSKGKVTALTVGKETISGTLSTDGLDGLLPKESVEELKRLGGATQPFLTTRVDDPGLVAELEHANVKFAGQVENSWLSTLLSWIAPALVFVGVWVLVMRRFGPQQGLMAIGKNKARVYVEHQTGVTFADVAGIDEARGELMEVVDFLKNPDRYRRLGGRIPKGVLIVGAPGTGKTLLAKAVAGEAGVPFFSLSGSDFVEMFVGVGAARVRDLFAQAQEKAPSIIFVDELDALGKARGVSPIVGGHDEREQTLNQLLAELDGFDTQLGVMILAATNRPEILDPALLRPGRFDRQVVLDRPDLRGRESILKVHVRDVTLAPALDLALVAARTPGFVGADLANLVTRPHSTPPARVKRRSIRSISTRHRPRGGRARAPFARDQPQGKGDRRLPRGGPCGRRRIAGARGPRGEDLRDPSRRGRARVHAAATDRGPVPDDAGRAARSARRAARRPGGGRAHLRRHLDGRPG